jgi:hypothetical protein
MKARFVDFFASFPYRPATDVRGAPGQLIPAPVWTQDMAMRAQAGGLLPAAKTILRRTAPGLVDGLRAARFRLRNGWDDWGWRPLVWRFLPDRWVTAHQYRIRNGVWPDLDHPKDLCEKLLWLKLHDHSPLHTLCADKLRVRDYVAERWGAEILVPLLATTRDPEDIRPERIAPERFVAKTNHDQGGVYICRDRATFDWAHARRMLALRLRRNHYRVMREPQYRDIEPAILVEALIETDAPEGLSDYKFYCFGGRPAFVQVNIGRQARHIQLFYDLDWIKLPCWRTYPDIAPDAARPRALARMAECAAALSAPFAFCRVDLYDTPEGIRFGEITFHPGAGLKRFHPPEFERRFGDMLVLPRR